MEAQFENLRSKLIVSCQALEDEPLHSSFIMGRMAKAAYEGGAAGIRANTVEDILEIERMFHFQSSVLSRRCMTIQKYILHRP